MSTRTLSVQPADPAPALAARSASRRATSVATAALIVLFAAMSLVGATHPALYRRETPSYAIQALGQGFMDTLVTVPWLVVASRAARRGSRKGRLLLAGGLLYAVYEFVIYAFAVHYNALFFVYCAGLGLSVFTCVRTMDELVREDVRSWFQPSARVRAPALLLLAVALAFGFSWLYELVPALLHGTVPASVVEADLPTNPVHVLDLSLLLPAHVAAAVLLLGRRPLGYLLAPVLLAFGVLMTASIVAVAGAMFARGLAPLGVALGMFVLCLTNAGVLTRLFGDLR
jgi:hypothetical protein